MKLDGLRRVNEQLHEPASLRVAIVGKPGLMYVHHKDAPKLYLGANEKPRTAAGLIARGTNDSAID